MNIAFIVLCHKNRKQLERLFAKIRNIGDIYVHVDNHNPMLRQELDSHSYLNVLSEYESFYVEWGGLSMINATLSLIKKVIDSGKNYDYIWLISGQDYPLKSNYDIKKYLEENAGTNFIELIQPGMKRYKEYLKRCQISYPKWINKNTFLVKVIKRLYMILTGGYEFTFPFLRRKKTFNGDFVFGSQWWALTNDTAKWILNYCQNNKEFYNYFKKVLIPDEVFFQTLFCLSPFKEKQLTNLTYVNWGSNRRSPENFTEKDLDKIKKAQTDYCFARKFDLIDSSLVMDYIDGEIN